MADGFLEKRAQDMERRRERQAAARRARWKKALAEYRRKRGESSSE